ncbi:hypothetical protein NE683_08000 [Bariatricus massiliensis]|uniref:Uncharacterized protein n=1 Tax=Bariatricus massiliensis TaxID=1745713 RepID=A0ABS8DBV1_9FIRM|nr:DUF6674 family protein [Bariatricus massiliensis]MCB7303614.1 hypothetical protein [Bariatricus massiliensis]MCB7373029.1 hypothetical protein [Bariatricus massiliensis]MCB7385699.1 hypothetical protein [Bariatricus massiliensis]MCB7409862.1 hypothetical protein [Bariatricus massiliensis]MCQ5253170.1 hypothetical protein [Bariatricus massiliensis]
MAKRKEADTPILENEAVKELLALLKENQAQGGKELAAAIGQVAEMEKQLAEAVGELKTMREDLAQMQNHPLKAALQKSIITLQDRILALRDNLAELKAGVIEGCKKALADFKVRGVAALDNAARFFHIKSGLETMRDNLGQSIGIDQKAIAKIEAVSAEYHEAGRHLKNIGRTLTGKEAVQEAKPAGKLAKTIEAPYRAELACLHAMKKSVEKAIDRVSRLEQAAEKKPSILKTMQEHKEKAQPPQEKAAPAVSHDGR